MTEEPVWAARHLLDTLEDPFAMLPMEAVVDALYKEVDEAETRKIECTSPFDPAARKFWSVEKEYHHDTIGLFVGALFVLGQAAITQTESVLNQLRKLPRGQCVIPNDKDSKLRQYAATESNTGLSKMVIINAASNYFKHGFVWAEDWTAGNSGSKREADTIQIVLKLGMSPKSEMTDNLLLAADRLGLSISNTSAVTLPIQNWRDGWARALYSHFGLSDPNSFLAGEQ